MTPAEIKAVMLRLEFRRRHTETCRGKKKIGEWDFLPNRAVCACPYYSCGVHSDSEGFKRRATGKITLDAAKAVTRVRLERGDWQAEIEDPTLVNIDVAIEDFMGDVRTGVTKTRPWTSTRPLWISYKRSAMTRGSRTSNISGKTR